MDKAAKGKRRTRSRNQPDDVVLLHARTDDNEGYRALRARDGQLEVAEIRPAKEGQPLAGELVKLKPRPDFPLLCDVEVLFRQEGDEPPGSEEAEEGEGGTTGHEGPARVSSRSYRKNWDEVFRSRSRKRPGPAN
jgi:hypothetical protein